MKIFLVSGQAHHSLKSIMQNLEKKNFVREMFDDIHDKYDFLNTVLSFGQDKCWRRKAVKDIPSNGLTIDLCSGGGQLAKELFSRSDFSGDIILADIAPNMLRHSRQILGPKYDGRFCAVICDVEMLPFKDEVFDGAISAFSLRNLSDLEAFSHEVRRALKNNGEVRLLEIGHPDGRLFSRLFEMYFYRISPKIAEFLSSKKYAYRYLPNSLKSFPPQTQVTIVLGKGWAKSSYANLMRGIAAIYKLSKKIG